MPVQFPCERCRTTLSIARRKIGTEINCPRCGQGMRVPTEAEAEARRLQTQAAAAQPKRTYEGLLFREFAVFDDDEADAADPFTGVMGGMTQAQPSPPPPQVAPSPELPLPAPTAKAAPPGPPQTGTQQTSAPLGNQPPSVPPPSPTLASAPPVSEAPSPPPISQPPVSDVPSTPPPGEAPPTNKPPEEELFLAPLTLVPEEDQAASEAPDNATAQPAEAPPVARPVGKKESHRRWADSPPTDGGHHSSSSGSFWADPVPPVQKSAPPVQRSAPPIASVPPASAPPVSVGTLTGRAATVVARQKAVKPVPGGWLLVPRRTIFVQGILIAIVGLLAFMAGWFAGGGSSGQPAGEQPAGAAPMETVLVQGTLTYRSAEGRVEGDDGAVILIWPKDAFAEPRIDPTELHPGQDAPAEGSRAMLALEEIGALHVRALSDGTFNLVVPRRGDYYVLFVSRRTFRSAGESVDERAMDALRRVFAPAATGIDRQKYHLTLEHFDSGLEMRSHDFGRSGA